MSRSINSTVTTEIQRAYNRPIELYILFLRDFTLYLASNDTDVQFYAWDTDNETTSTSVAQTYTAIGISRDDIKSHADSKIDSVRLTVDNVNRAMTTYLANNDFRGRRLIILKVFADLLEDNANYIQIFDGLMDSFAVSEMSAIFTATTRLGNLDMQIPRRRYQASCNWTFGDEFCTYDIDATSIVGALADAGSTSGTLVDAERTEPDGYWRFGTIEITAGVNNGMKRRVASSSGSQITFDITFPSGISAGTAYTLKRGCSKTHLWCSGLANLDNFGGFPTIPDLFG